MANAIKACSFEGCNRGLEAKGLCSKHYQRLKRNGDPSISKYNREQTGNPCSVDGCGEKSGNHGMCLVHYRRFFKTGSVNGFLGSYRARLDWVAANAGYKGTDCLIWPFQVGDHGRGTVTVNYKSISAPKYMCTLAHGAPPSPKHQAAHSCGKGHEGCMNPSHLRWATAKENEKDKIVHGTLRKGADINTAKLSEDQVRSIRESKEKGVSLADRYKVTPTTISAIRQRKIWAWVDFAS